MPDPFEEFIDSCLEADFEFEDIKRVIKEFESNSKIGIDRLDSEKLLSEFCSLRYKYAFMFISFSAINHITKPKSDFKRNISHIRKAINLLIMLKCEMESLHNSMLKEKDDDPAE